MKKFFVDVFCFCIGLSVLFSNLEAQETTRLSGKLVKRYYPAPRIVKNAAFGWYLELNKASQEVIHKQFQQISKKDQSIFKALDIDLQTVQCTFCSDDILLSARLFDGVFITIEGALDAPCLSRKYLCFSIEPNAILSKSNNKKSHFSLDEFDHLSQRFYVKNASSNESEMDSSLKLSEDAPEILVVLKGQLILRLFPGPPEYTSIEKGDRADYCWMLHVNEEFFKIATTTSVSEPSTDLQSIMEWSNHNEIYLSLEDNMIDFCCDHESQEITVNGYLFHAHTAHHYSPILMNVQKVFNSKDK